MTEAPSALLRTWLRRRLPETANSWLEEQLDRLATDPSDRTLHIALGMVPRKLGKTDLDLDAAERAAAQEARPGWDPADWSVDEAARILLLCETAGSNVAFAERFADLCRSADVAEAIALYRGLPLYPASDALDEQAAEGLRTNIRAIFEAVAQRNPYPRERFDEHRWNHMVLKALFIGSRLAPIQGLDERANPELAQIMSDYAHERWAAGRPVTPELWRCVGPFAEGAVLADLVRVAESGDRTERQAAALALAASPAEDAEVPLQKLADMSRQVAAGELTWDSLVLES